MPIVVMFLIFNFFYMLSWHLKNKVKKKVREVNTYKCVIKFDPGKCFSSHICNGKQTCKSKIKFIPQNSFTLYIPLTMLTLESIVSGNKPSTEPTLVSSRGLELLMVLYAFFIREGRKLHCLLPQPTSQCGFLRKGWNNCSLSLHLCDTEKPENPPWISMKNPIRATCGMGAAEGWSGCNILELAMIAEYSGRQVGTHLLMLFLHFISKCQREKSATEALIKCIIWILLVLLTSTLHLTSECTKYEHDIQLNISQPNLSLGKKCQPPALHICILKLCFPVTEHIPLNRIAFRELTKLFQGKGSALASQTTNMAYFSFIGKPHADCIHCMALTNVTRLPITLDFALVSIVREVS